MLKTAGELASGAAKFTWTPKTNRATSTGTLEIPLTETPSVRSRANLTACPFSPLTLSGKTSMTFTGGSTCATKALKKGTFTGTTVALRRVSARLPRVRATGKRMMNAGFANCALALPWRGACRGARRLRELEYN